ncbi:MAG: hypothetical protein JWR23_3286 [Mucilaginibacter sp.]|nr:hypothetical protein [Mucilaginibacter sp.]
MSAAAQTLPGYEQHRIKDSLPKSYLHSGLSPQKKHFGRAAGELAFVEILPWTFDKFLKKADYTNISFKTVGNNLKPASWTWDDDNFQTNQFGHPFHGSQFYNSFRSNGYSLWQSAPAVFVGSYVWESTAENQPPAINDFINTSFGGIVLGEMTHRLSNKLINSNRSGLRRQASEVLGFLINPVNGLNRILDGKWGKVTHQQNKDSSKISVDFDIGFRRFNANNTNFIKNGDFGWFGHIKILYGTPYKDYDTPFSNIAINVEVGKDDSSKVNIVSVYGSLAGWEIESTEKLQHLAILSANYDFIHNAAFFYGGQSVKINLLSEYDITEKIKVNTIFGAGPILLAAIPDPYLYLSHGRNYDYGPGFSVNGSGQITIANRFFYSINYRGGWMVTINGHPSHYFLHTLSSEINIKASKEFSLSAESGYFNLHGSYQKYADVGRNYPYFKISTRYSLNF